MQTMTDPYMQYELESGVVARWRGGEYIELGAIDGGEFVAEDVINVWDYEQSKPYIARTLDAFRAKVDERIVEIMAEGDAE